MEGDCESVGDGLECEYSRARRPILPFLPRRAASAVDDDLDLAGVGGVSAPRPLQGIIASNVFLSGIFRVFAPLISDS